MLPRGSLISPECQSRDMCSAACLHDTRSAVLSCMRCYVGTRGTTARPIPPWPALLIRPDRHPRRHAHRHDEVVILSSARRRKKKFSRHQPRSLMLPRHDGRRRSRTLLKDGNEEAEAAMALRSPGLRPFTSASVRFADPATSSPWVVEEKLGSLHTLLHGSTAEIFCLQRAPLSLRCRGVAVAYALRVRVPWPHAGCGWCGDPATSHCVQCPEASKAVSCASAPSELVPSD